MIFDSLRWLVSPGKPYRWHRRIVFVILKVVFACLAGYTLGQDRLSSAISFNFLVFPLLFGFCRAARIEFGFSGLLWRQLAAHIFICCIVLAAVGLPFAFSYELFGTDSANDVLGLAAALTCGCTVSILGGTPIYLTGALIASVRGLYGIALPIENVPRYMPLYGWTAALWALTSAFARYQKDQSALGLLGIVVCNSISIGHAYAGNRGKPWLSAAIALALAYLQVLWMRRGRRFPPALRDCKFVTLDYLRRAAASGQGIRRCQDLPAEAFGDAQKARYVISISHRWLDHYMCDLRSNEHPEGTRLSTMVSSLDQYFSTKGLWSGRGFWNRLERISMALTGGRDVVLFFDFMSLPQESRAPDGKICPRSKEEQELFDRCLPSMGALYSMLPVLVCEEVPQGINSYMDSGWCFAEVSTAWLGNQLKPFSCSSKAMTWFTRLSQHSDWMLSDLARGLEDELQRKHFFKEEDREEVRQIIRGFLVKSLLVAALKKRSVSELQQVLACPTLRTRGLLDQAIDAHLNSPLHLAVALNFPDGVRLLLDASASRTLRNYRGDTPVECCIWPRLSKAARVCRSYRPCSEGVPPAPVARPSISSSASTFAPNDHNDGKGGRFFSSAEIIDDKTEEIAELYHRFDTWRVAGGLSEALAGSLQNDTIEGSDDLHPQTLEAVDDSASMRISESRRVALADEDEKSPRGGTSESLDSGPTGPFRVRILILGEDESENREEGQAGQTREAESLAPQQRLEQETQQLQQQPQQQQKQHSSRCAIKEVERSNEHMDLAKLEEGLPATCSNKAEIDRGLRVKVAL